MKKVIILTVAVFSFMEAQSQTHQKLDSVIDFYMHLINQKSKYDFRGKFSPPAKEIQVIDSFDLEQALVINEEIKKNPDSAHGQKEILLSSLVSTVACNPPCTGYSDGYLDDSLGSEKITIKRFSKGLNLFFVYAIDSHKDYEVGIQGDFKKGRVTRLLLSESSNSNSYHYEFERGSLFKKKTITFQKGNAKPAKMELSEFIAKAQFLFGQRLCPK